MRHKEEVKFTFNDLRLLNEARVDVGSLRRVVNEVLPIVAGRLLEESLTDSLVHDDQRDVRMLLGRCIRVTSVLHRDDAIELLELLVDDLLAHGVSYTVTIDEHMARQLSIVELAISLE